MVSLSKPERAELAILLLGSLDDTHDWVEDEEVERQSSALDSGAVVGVNREEFGHRHTADIFECECNKLKTNGQQDTLPFS